MHLRSLKVMGVALAALLPGLTLSSVARADTAAAPVAWADCADGFQCGSLNVPLDYDQPNGRRIALAMIKLPAADPAHRIGTLFVNFGGPGASGVDRLRLRSDYGWLFSPELKARFDLVSWDTRGVFRSAAVRCFQTEAEQSAFFGRQPAFPVGQAEEDAFFADAAELGQRCASRNGDLLNHLSSANTARDLDRMRQAVGDRRLSYLGLSYGTYVGATYANLFPERVRAMVLDGTLDFIGNATGHGDAGRRLPIDTRQDVPQGMAETFNEFLVRCERAGAGCAFAGDARGKFDRLEAAARAHPITLDGQDWTYAAIAGMVTGNLAHVRWWSDLAVLLQQLSDAASGAPVSLARRAVQEEYDNLSEAFYATNCADSTVPTDTARYRRLGVTEDQRVPYFGPIGVYDYMPCAAWPGRDTDRYTGPWNRPTAAPILVVNNRYDPATPLAGARDATAELARAQLLVIEGAGHTGMFVPSVCGERVKREYLFTGVLPPASTTCAMDDDPFGG